MAKEKILKLAKKRGVPVKRNNISKAKRLSKGCGRIKVKYPAETEESYYVDSIEMVQINSDKGLLKKLKAGHGDAKKKRGKRTFRKVKSLNQEYNNM